MARPVRDRPAEGRRNCSSYPRRPAPSAASSGSSPKSGAVAPSASPAAGQSATTSCGSSASTPASTTRPVTCCRSLRHACPKGVDVDFENVGGEILDTLLRVMNPFSRIVVCGLIAEYNATEPHGYKMLRSVLVNRIRMQGMIVFDWKDRYGEALEGLGRYLAEGKLKYRESVVHGLENAPKGLIALLKGGEFRQAACQARLSAAARMGEARLSNLRAWRSCSGSPAIAGNRTSCAAFVIDAMTRYTTAICRSPTEHSASFFDPLVKLYRRLLRYVRPYRGYSGLPSLACWLWRARMCSCCRACNRCFEACNLPVSTAGLVLRSRYCRDFRPPRHRLLRQRVRTSVDRIAGRFRSAMRSVRSSAAAAGVFF